MLERLKNRIARRELFRYPVFHHKQKIYAKLIFDYLEKFGQANRAEINTLLTGKLIGNLLTKLRRQDLILNAGSRSKPIWKLAERNEGRNKRDSL